MIKRKRLDPKQSFHSCENVLKVLSHVSKGGLIILTDDEDRENEGDLVFAAQDVSAEKINFMAKEARGLICLSLASSYVERLKLPMMTDLRKDGSKLGTAFTVSIEAKRGVTTGISASDRAETIRVAVDNDSSSDDLVVPGHVFPLRARKLGVLERCGHTEASVDLMGLAQKKTAAVICEILKDNGELARGPDLEKFSKQHGIPRLTIRDLVIFRMLKEKVLEKEFTRAQKTDFGDLDGSFFSSLIDHRLFVVLTKNCERRTSTPLDVFIRHGVCSWLEKRDENQDFFSRALFLAKDFMSNVSSGVFILSLSPESTQGLYEQTKTQGFITQLLIERSLHKRELLFCEEEPSDLKGLGLGLAYRDLSSYKEIL